MTIVLRQSTAGQEIPLGRFLDSVDGNTEKTALTIANTDIKIWKFGATSLVNKNSGGATHMANGEYYCVLDATDTDTLGSMEVSVHVSGALYVRKECVVLSALVYDSLIAGTDNLQVDLIQIAGAAVNTASAQLGVNAVSIANGAVTAAAIATDAIDSDALAASAINEIQSGLATVANQTTINDNVLTAISGISGVQSDTNDIQARLPAALIGGLMPSDAVAISGSTVAADNVEANITNLDAAVSSRLASASYTTPPSAVTIAAAVWASADRQLTAISTTLRNQIADNVIRRTFANAAASADGDTKTERSLLGAIARLVNRSAIVGATLTVYEADDTTALFTQTLTTDAAADPVVEADTNP